MVFKRVSVLMGVLSLIVACKNIDNGGISGNSKDSVDINGKIQIHKPYCGGAAPSPEQAEGFNEALPNAVFYLYKDSLPDDKDDLLKVTTDEKGGFDTKLTPGSYHLIQEAKLGSLEEFIKAKRIDDDHYKSHPEECYERWFNAPDFSFVVTDTTGHNPVLTEWHRCFTGANPCLIYTGPYPP